MMDLLQTKTVGLTMKLNLKAKEFSILCKKLDELKKKNINPNDERLLEIKDLFVRNNEEISEIIEQINKLNQENIRIEEKYNPDNIFKNKQESAVIENTNLPVEIKKETFFKKLISFIKRLFNKTN